MAAHYFEFLTAQRPLNALRGIETAPNFYINTIQYSCAFVAFTFLTPHIFKFIFPAWFSGLPSQKRKEFPAYIVSLLHHLVVVPIGWIYVYKDYQAVNYGGNIVDYAPLIQFIGPFCAAYIISDTICYAIPEATKGRLEYLIHHILALWLLVPFLYGPSSLSCFYSHILICETTGIFFNVSWILRVVGWKDSTAVFLLELLFALGFFFTRFVNLTVVFWVISFSLGEVSVGVGVARYNLLFVAIMQWYWMFKIVGGMAGKISKKLLAFPPTDPTRTTSDSTVSSSSSGSTTDTRVKAN